MWAVRIRDYVSPNLPTYPGSDALPVTKKLVMADVIDLPTDQLSFALHVPATQATDARQVANLRISFMPVQITFFELHAKHEVIEAVGGVSEEPRSSTHPRPEDAISWPTLPVPLVTITQVVRGLKPVQPIGQPSVIVDKAGKDRRQELRQKLEWNPNQEKKEPLQINHGSHL